MIDPTSVPANETGGLRLYGLRMSPEHAKFLREPGAAEQVLGAEGLNAEQIEVFPVSDLDELGLYGYLSEGCGVSEDQLDETALDAVTGWVMLVRSAAFRGAATQLKIDDRLTLIGCYREDQVDWSHRPIPAASAKPYSAPSAPMGETGSRRQIGFSIIIVVAALAAIALLWLVL